MKQLHATYNVVTPMFLTADPKGGEVGFRLPSFKGALRFWWRALAWSEVMEGTSDVASALRELHRREGETFGSVAGELGRQSRVLLSAEWQPAGTVSASAVRSRGSSGQANGIGYLMGQGLNGRDAADGGTIHVDATFRAGTDKRTRLEVERALLALGLLGGLGSRARRGFGSLVIDALDGDGELGLAPPTTVEELGTVLGKLVGDRGAPHPPYSAFSARSRIDVSWVGASAARVHDAVGSQMRDFREELVEDTRRARETADGREPDQPPERSIFGLPLQFYFKRDRATVFVEPGPPKDRIDRRASPLLIHLHRFADEANGSRFAALQTFLPAQFLPEGKGIQIRRKRDSGFPFPDFTPPESLINQYLDSFPSPRKLLS